MTRPPEHDKRQDQRTGPSGQPTQATLVTAADPNELSPIEAAIIDLCNELYEIAGGLPVAPLGIAGSDDPAAGIRRRLLTLLEKYDASNAEAHPNPDWARPNQRALAMSALGEPEAAIELELDALEHADTTRRLEISLGNLADRCIRLGRYDEAVVFGLRAQEVAPGSAPILLTTAQAMHLAGFSDEADMIFGAFLEDPDAPRPGTELWAYLESESRLASMADDLPALAELRARWLRVSSTMNPDMNDTTDMNDRPSEGGRP